MSITSGILCILLLVVFGFGSAEYAPLERSVATVYLDRSDLQVAATTSSLIIPAQPPPPATAEHAAHDGG